jgi:hypothetical protein
MAPRTVAAQIKAEFRKRKGVSKSRKGSKLNITKEKAVNILTEKCVNVRDCRASGKVVLSQEKPLNELSVEEQIFRLIGEISDDEDDVTVESDSRRVDSKSFELARQEKPLNELSVEQQVLRLKGEISDDECDSSPISEIRYPDVDISALSVRRRQKIIDLFGDDDVEIDAALRPGFPRTWQLVGIDVEVQHRPHQKSGAGSSGELFRCLSQAKHLFSVDPLQLNDFENVWESFDPREVSGEISCYRPKNSMQC